VPAEFTHPVTVRYLEVDQQGVVFNMWYLAYFDDALVGFLECNGLDYPDLQEAGYDVQLVHVDIDWRGGVSWRDEVRIAVSVARLGTTSVTLAYQVRRAGVPVVDASVVYVCVATDGSGKRAIPDLLLQGLGQGNGHAPQGTHSGSL
jgi:acyl-CoA thioester hydrolase